MLQKTLPTSVGSLVLTTLDKKNLIDISWGVATPEFEGDLPLFEEASEEILAYLSGKVKNFTTPYAFNTGTTFEQTVWKAIAQIPFGEVVTYGTLAKKINSSPRAVGTACGKNPIALIVPCHRVVGHSGKLTGYSGGQGVVTKKHLLLLEGALKT